MTQYIVHAGRTHRSTDDPQEALSMASTAGEEAYVTGESSRHPGRPKIVWTPGMPNCRSPLVAAAELQ